MKFILTDGKTELVLPVTPDSFNLTYGNRIETINIHEVGDVNIAGYGALAAPRIDCLFPAHDYPFIQPGANTADPYSYVAQLQKWIDDKVVIRFIISDSPVNLKALVEEIEYGEQDGTGDVYAGISLRQYRELAAVQTGTAENTIRTQLAPVTTAKTYTVVAGDTLSAICRKFYGNANLYPQLASFNKLKNANIIRVGDVLQLPDIDVLKATKVTSSLTPPGTVKKTVDLYLELKEKQLAAIDERDSG